MVSEKTKHIHLKFHFVKVHMEKGKFRLKYLPTEEIVVDTLTKPLPGPSLSIHTSAVIETIGQMNRHIP
jgi:hypothetical protein